MRNRVEAFIISAFLVLLLAGVSNAQTAQARPAGTQSSQAEPRARNIPSLKQIMADPSWFARSPELVGWLPGSEGVLYDRRREGVVGRDTTDRYLQTLTGLQPAAWPSMIEEVQRASLIPANGVYSSDRSRHLTERAGDLFLFENGRWKQLTRTSGRESSPMFMVGDTRIAFRRGGDWVIRDLGAGMESQAADIRFADDPAEEEDEERGDLEQQQRDLFQVIRERDERDELNETIERSRRDNDPTRVPGPFYLDKSKRSVGRWLSPSGRHLLVALADNDQARGKNDLMPSYVTESGYVTTSNVRPKVGTQPERADSFVLLDLRRETVIELGLADLPTITDDPLAEIRAAVAAREADESDEQTKKKDTEPNTEPRPVTNIGVRWSDTGDTAAIMLRSHDNKDRWIVTLDVADPSNDAEPSFQTAHHLRDPAWINWSFNEFGFVPGTDTLWFLSEHTGYGHLYTLEPGQTEPTALTSGEHEVRSVYPFYDNSGFLVRTNAGDPAVWELERVFMDGQRTRLTAIGGDVQSYRVSPDETRAIVEYSSAMNPPELAAVSITGPQQPVRVTQTHTQLFQSFDFTEPEFVWVPSSHADKPIYTRVYRPDPERFPGPRPIVIFAHGAGYLQFVQNSWEYYFREHMFHTLLTERGMLVLAPDFRASAGYGRDWRAAIYRVMGYPELEDFDDCIAWAKAEGIGDPDRVGIYGGSYGGFMTLMAMFLRPDVYDAGAALRSVTDWRHYNHGYTSNILDTPDIDPEPFNKSSPITHAEGLQGRLLMCHGLLDDNVVAQDIIRLAQRLIELEKTGWELAVYPVEPHGFREPSSWHDEYRRILELFEETLID